MKDYYIDLHCHPSLKPFGKGFELASRKRKNSTNRKHNNSIWHRKRPTVIRKVLNILTSLTKFTQADFTTVNAGKGKVIMASLYPMEKGMILDANGVDYPGRILRNIATGIGMKRIRHLQRMTDYFKDLEDEYNYFVQKNEVIVTIERRKTRYKLVRNFDEMLNDNSVGIDTLYVIITIEGAHVFNCGLKLANKPIANEIEVLGNIQKVKNWEFPPFFVGIAHHFYNELCGQAESLQGIVGKIIHQDDDCNQGITPLGVKVIDALLNNNNGKRIQIDLKHMNVKSRNEYYELLSNKYKTEDIPIIVSHGAVIGKDNAIDKNNTAQKRFTTDEINFYDNEIFKIEETNGVFGIQLDERRLIHKKDRGVFKNTNIGRKKMLRIRSEFVWNQIEHIAIILDAKNKDAWSIQCLGTDFDGIVDPLNGWWTSRELGFIDSYLETHANAFLNSAKGKSLKKKNKLRAEEIIAKFMYLNAESFMQNYFI